MLKRMLERQFSEVDLRTMLEVAHGVRRDIEPGRWLVEARHEGKTWQIVVEPDHATRSLVVITAYAVA